MIMLGDLAIEHKIVQPNSELSRSHMYPFRDDFNN